LRHLSETTDGDLRDPRQAAVEKVELGLGVTN